MSDTAQDHINLADAYNGQVIEPLRMTERKHDEAKKKQMQFYQKLLTDRDRTYADRAKVRIVNEERSAHSLYAHFCSPEQTEGNLSCRYSIRAALTMSQYDEECVEVDAYRQKQVHTTSPCQIHSP